MPILATCPGFPKQEIPNATAERHRETGQRVIADNVVRGWLSDDTAMPERDAGVPLPTLPNVSRYRDANRTLEHRGPARRRGGPPWPPAGAGIHLPPPGGSDPSPAA